MKIATFNINGIKARLPRLIQWLAETRPAVACLQEIKSQDEGFPAAEIEALGYAAIWHGQKSFNGVAILADTRAGYTLTEVQRGLGIPGPNEGEGEQARYLEVDIFREDSAAARPRTRIICIYLPNGNPTGSDKFTYKLAWLARLRGHVAGLLATEEPFVLGGDYNVAPSDDDVHDPKAFADDALCRPESRAGFRRVLWLGLTDALATCQPGAGHFTWWDYRGGAFHRRMGLRIDLLLATPPALARIRAAEIDREYRKKQDGQTPSDHAPVWVDREP